MAFTVSDFSIVPEELLMVAIRFGEYVEREGYDVVVEPAELAQPSTPVFRITRSLTTKFIHVATRPDLEELLDWAGYARTFDSDTRVVVALPDNASLTIDAMSRLSDAQVGVVHVAQTDVKVVVPPGDLTLNLVLPRLPPGTHQHLGDAWDLMRRGDWMEGFDEACQVLNRLGAEHLASKVQSGALTLSTATTPAQIRKATLGALGAHYSQVRKPGRIESTIEGVIKDINDNRITVAHYKRDPDRQPELRAKLNRQTYLIVAAIKHLV